MKSPVRLNSQLYSESLHMYIASVYDANMNRTFIFYAVYVSILTYVPTVSYSRASVEIFCSISLTKTFIYP